MKFLPHQKIQIFFHEDQYDRDYKIQARRHYHGPWVERYIQEKMSLSHSAMESIDWEGIHKSNEMLSRHGRATRSKFVYRWSYTTARSQVIEKSHTDICPLCKQAREDHQHVLFCKDCRVAEQREEALETLREQLNTLHTHPDLVTLIIRTVEREQVHLIDTEGHQLHSLLQDILHTQTDIGWRNFRLGLWSQAWKGVQTAYAKDRGYKMDGAACASKAQLALWRYVLSLWKHRNDVIHGKDYEERRRLKIAEMRKKVEEVLKDPPTLGPSGQHLLEIQDIAEKSRRTQKDWLRSVKVEAGKEQRRRAQEQRQQETAARLLHLRVVAENGPKVNARKQQRLHNYIINSAILDEKEHSEQDERTLQEGRHLEEDLEQKKRSHV